MEWPQCNESGCSVCFTLCALMQVRGAGSHEEDKFLHKDKPVRWHFGFPNKVL